MKQANPADYIPKARNAPGAEYEGDWGCTEWGQWDRYVRLHAGRSILQRMREALILHTKDRLGGNFFLVPAPERAQWDLIQVAVDEIEREIREVKR